MGIIQRQGIKYSIVSYFGLLIGSLSTLFIYPLNLETYGLAQFLISSAALLSPIFIMGINVLPIKFRPYFEDKKSGHRGFLSLLFLLTCILSATFTIVFLAGQDFFIKYLSLLNPTNADKIRRYFIYLLPFSLLSGWNVILTNYIISFERIVVPNLLTNFLLKLTLPAFILMTVYAGWNDLSFIRALIVIQTVVLLGLLAYIHHLGQLKLSGIQWPAIRPYTKEMRNFALYGMVGNLGGILAFRIDTIMIPALIDFASNGAYALAVFMANAIAIPTGSIIRIAAPVISNAIKRKDYESIRQIYKDASLNLLWIGMLSYVLVMVNIRDIVSIFPTERDLRVLIPVAGLLGAAKIVDMITSTNNEIIGYSRYYRYNLLAIILLSILSVSSNYYFIRIAGWGLIGAAFATALSLMIFNILKGTFIMIKFRMHPFQKGLLTIILAGILLYFTASFIQFHHPWINIISRSAFTTGLYVWLMYRLKVSHHWNRIIAQVLSKLGWKIKSNE